MLVDAARKRHLDIVVQTPSRADPASANATKLILAETQDINGTSQLLQDCTCVTFENEWVNTDQLALLEKDDCIFLPPLSALKVLVDKISQRQLLGDMNISGPDWMPLSSNEIGASKLPVGWEFPLMAKSARGGYDGKGTKVINDFSDLIRLIESVELKDWLVEKWIKYEKELALVASRDQKGRVRLLPLVETKQFKQVCDWVIAPTDLGHPIEAMAYNIASSLLRELNYVGVLAIEFFYGPSGLLVNEVAPRTHNSAHFSIEATNASQFDQQICIAAGLPLPDPHLVVPGALMVNLLGLNQSVSSSTDQRLMRLQQIKGANVHWYGKDKETPGRKMGHVTMLLSEDDPQKRREEALKGLNEIRAVWPLNEAVLV